MAASLRPRTGRGGRRPRAPRAHRPASGRGWSCGRGCRAPSRPCGRPAGWWARRAAARGRAPPRRARSRARRSGARCVRPSSGRPCRPERRRGGARSPTTPTPHRRPDRPRCSHARGNGAGAQPGRSRGRRGAGRAGTGTCEAPPRRSATPGGCWCCARRARAMRPRAPGREQTGSRARGTRRRLSSRSLRCYRFASRHRLDRFHLQGGGQTPGSCVRWMCTLRGERLPWHRTTNRFTHTSRCCCPL